MLEIERQISAELKRQEQREHLKRLKKSREKQAKEKNEQRRTFIAGRIFLEVFPEFLSLQPKIAEDENNIEFAPLKNFLMVLAAKEKLVDILKAEAAIISASSNIYNDEE